MEQMNMAGFEIVPIDYESSFMPRSVKEFRPTVYKDGDSYCVVLGPDPVAEYVMDTTAAADWVIW